jgi:transposase
MEIDGRQLSTEEQAFIRRTAVQRVWDGESPGVVMNSYGLCRTSIYPWLRKANAEGLDALAPRLRPGREPKLSELEEQEVARWVTSGDPRQYGFDFGLWTREIVADLVAWRLGVELSVNSVGRLLHRQGITPQKPVRRAYERNPEAVQNWLDERYPEIEARAKRTGARIFWLDEAAIRSDDPLQRTWGRKGETPVVATSGQRQAINAISALTNRGAFWYHVYGGRLNAGKFIECLQDFLASQRGKLIVIMDGHPVHKAKKVQQWIEQRAARLEVELLPSYAPDLNPDEFVWHQMRHKGTSKKPLKKGESLKQRAIDDLEAIKHDKALLRRLFWAPSVFYAAA